MGEQSGASELVRSRVFLKGCWNHVRDKQMGGKNIRVPNPADVTKENITPDELLALIDNIKAMEGR